GFDPKTPPIAPPRLLRRPIELDQEEEQPLGTPLLAPRAFGRGEDAADGQFRSTRRPISSSEGIARAVAAAPPTQGPCASRLAPNRTGEQGRLPLSLQVGNHGTPSKTLVQIETTDPHSGLAPPVPQPLQHLDGFIPRQDKAQPQRPLLSVMDDVGSRDTVKAGRPIFSLPAHPERLRLGLLAVVGAVVEIYRHLLRRTLQLLRDAGTQGRIETELQLGQFFDAQLLIEIAADRLWIRCPDQVGTDRLNCPVISRNPEQHLVQVIRPA